MEINSYETLFEKFPNLYNKNPKKGLWGFECNLGWFELIEELSKELDEYCKKEKIKINPRQVKTKFAGLRFYYDLENNTPEEKRKGIEEIIKKYEQQSEQTCETCGKHGKKISKNNWLIVACEEHSK